MPSGVKCTNPQHIRRRKDGRCVACLQNAQQRHYRANPSAYKRRAKTWADRSPKQRQAILRRYNYGSQVDQIRPCPERCEICDKRPAKCFDHNHVTGKFRGWLCFRCNNALGAFGDNVAGVFAAIGYLLS